MMFAARWLTAIICAFLLSTSIGWAQLSAPPGTDKQAEKKTTASDKSEKGKKARPQPKVIPRMQTLEELTIIGRIQKPEVFYVLGKTNFSYKGLKLKRSFVDRIKKSVRSNPF
jgi:hypothetical protein